MATTSKTGKQNEARKPHTTKADKATSIKLNKAVPTKYYYEELAKNELTKASNCKSIEDVKEGIKMVEDYQKNHSEEKPNKMSAILLHWLNKKADFYKVGGKYVAPKPPAPKPAKNAVSKHIIPTPAKGTEERERLDQVVAKGYVTEDKPEVSALKTKTSNMKTFTNLKPGKTVLVLSEEPLSNKHLGDSSHTVNDKYVYIADEKVNFFKVRRLSDKREFILSKNYFTQK